MDGNELETAQKTAQKLRKNCAKNCAKTAQKLRKVLLLVVRWAFNRSVQTTFRIVRSGWVIDLCRSPYRRGKDWRRCSLWTSILSTSSENANRRGKSSALFHWNSEAVKTTTALFISGLRKVFDWNTWPRTEQIIYCWVAERSSHQGSVRALLQEQLRSYQSSIHCECGVILATWVWQQHRAVRDSIADVRKKNRIPTSTIPSLQVTKDNEFDRILLLVFIGFWLIKVYPKNSWKQLLHAQDLNCYRFTKKISVLVSEHDLRKYRRCRKADCARLQDAGERNESNLPVQVSIRRYGTNDRSIR